MHSVVAPDFFVDTFAAEALVAPVVFALVCDTNIERGKCIWLNCEDAYLNDNITQYMDIIFTVAFPLALAGVASVCLNTFWANLGTMGSGLALAPPTVAGFSSLSSPGFSNLCVTCMSDMNTGSRRREMGNDILDVFAYTCLRGNKPAGLTVDSENESLRSRYWPVWVRPVGRLLNSVGVVVRTGA